jgi:transketolase
MNTGKAHGAALGTAEVAAVKRLLGFDPEVSFHVDDPVIAHTRKALDRGEQAKAQWQSCFDAWARANPEGKALFERLAARRLPDGWCDVLPSWPVDPKGLATRAASGAVLNALAPVLPELWGGSADLAESNNTTMAGADSFGPVAATTKHWNAQPYGRTLHFGVREHAMGSILTGIVMHGPTRPYGGTFLTFSDYMRGAVRLAALMGARRSTCGPTTRSDSARTDPPISRWSTSPRCAPSPGCRSYGRATPTRRRTRGGPFWSGRASGRLGRSACA